MLYRIIERIISIGKDKGKRTSVVSFSHAGRVSFEDVIKRMEHTYGIRGGDIHRFTCALKEVILQEVQLGQIVEIDGLGSFGLSLKYKDPDNGVKYAFNRRYIRDAKVVFRPSKKMKIDVSKLSFERQREVKVIGDCMEQMP